MGADYYQDEQDRRAAWQCDIDECEECQARDDEMPCSDHDLDDPAVARRYGMARG